MAKRLTAPRPSGRGVGHKQRPGRNVGVSAGRLLVPSIHRSVPLTIYASDNGPTALLPKLEKLGLVTPGMRASNAEQFVGLGLLRLERQVGSFKFGHDPALTPILFADGYESCSDLCFGLTVGTPAIAYLRPLCEKLRSFGGHALERGFAMALQGRGVFGPPLYHWLVQRMEWMGEDDEVAAAHAEQLEPEDCDNLYRKADFIRDVAPWIVEAEPKDDSWLAELERFDPKLHRLTTRLLASQKRTMPEFLQCEDGINLDAALFLWEDGHRINDIYDGYYNSHYESGATIEHAWVARLSSRDDIRNLSHACEHLTVTADVARHIDAAYPARHPNSTKSP